MNSKPPPPAANRDIAPPSALQHEQVPADELEPATSAELDREEKEAIENLEHR